MYVHAHKYVIFRVACANLPDCVRNTEFSNAIEIHCTYFNTTGGLIDSWNTKTASKRKKMKARECRIALLLSANRRSPVGWGLKFYDFSGGRIAHVEGRPAPMVKMLDHTHLTADFSCRLRGLSYLGSMRPSLAWPHPVPQEREGVW